MKTLRDYFEPVVSLQEMVPPHWTMGRWNGDYSEWHRDDGHTVVIEQGSNDPVHVRLMLTSADTFTPRRRLRVGRRRATDAVLTALNTFIQWRLRKMRAAARETVAEP